MRRHCERCTLPGDHPMAHLDAEGICRPCRQHERWNHTAERMAEAVAEMDSVLRTARGEGDFDAIIAVSGGKDSCWTLHELGRRTSLRLLAITVDNGFLSEVALDNARRIADLSGARHEVFTPPALDMRRLFRTAAVEDLYPETRQGRASSICNACISVIKLHCLHVAQRERAPLLVWGWSPGQAPISAALYQPTAKMTQVFVERQFDPLHKVFPEHPDWISHPHFNDSDSLPRFVHPLAVWPYDEESIVNELISLGWTKPNDVDSTSTNCRLNALGVAIHQRRYGYHPYAGELSGLVRSNHMSPEESMRRQQPLPLTPNVVNIAVRLGLGTDIFS